MANVLYIPRTSGLKEGLGEIGNTLGEVLGRQRAQSQQKQYGSILEEELQKVGSSPDAYSLANLMANLEKRGVPNDAIKNVMSLFSPGLKSSAEQQGALSFFGNQQGQPGQPVGAQNMPLGMQAQESAPQQTQPDETIAIPGMGKVSTSMIQRAIANPNPLVKEWGKAANKQLEEMRKTEFTLAKPYIDTIANDKISLRNKENASKLIRSSIESGGVGPFSKADWARITGIPALQTMEGAQFDFGVKEFLLGNMSRVSAKGLNQWLEKRMATMIPQVGRSREGNLSVMEAIDSDLAIKRKEIEIYDKLLNESLQNQGKVPFDLESQVEKQLQPYADMQEKKLSYRLKQLEDHSKPYQSLLKETKKKVPSGTPLTKEMFYAMKNTFGTPEKAVTNAKALGYSIFDRSEIEEFENRNL